MKKLKKFYKSSYKTEEDIPKRYFKNLNASEKKKMISEVLERPQNLKYWSADKAYEKRIKKQGKTIPKSKWYAAYIRKYGIENAGSIEKISNVTGMSVKILKEVYKRGIGAWTSGHRPGVKPAQWAMARVYSFVMGGKTTEKSDKDLWEKL